jgi:hypothetical protein
MADIGPYAINSGNPEYTEMFSVYSTILISFATANLLGQQFLERGLCQDPEVLHTPSWGILRHPGPVRFRITSVMPVLPRMALDSNICPIATYLGR